ncbi:unnamed protein product, partial [Effrenium voratum]
MATSLPDYYGLFGVERESDQDAIKKIYRKLVLQWHPDKHPQNRDAAEEKIREINDAYETLSNPFKRSQYDNMLVALERKAKGFRLDTTMIKPRMSIPKEFMLSPLGFPDKFVRVVGMSLFVQARGDAKAEFYDFFKEAKFSLWWLPEVNNMCRIRPQATAGVGQDGGLNFNFALSRQISVSEVILSPGQMGESAAFIAVASDVFKVVGGTVDEKVAIDFMLVDYAKMFQYITLEEVLQPAVTKLGGQNDFVSLDDLRQDKNVRLYFESVQKKPIWADEDFELFFATRANLWHYDARGSQVRLRSKHEQMAALLQRARSVAEVAAAISASDELDIERLPLETIEAMGRGPALGPGRTACRSAATGAYLGTASRGPKKAYMRQADYDHVLLATASGYKLTKSNESSISLLEAGELPECKGLPLQGSASGADEWQCDTLHGELGTSDEFKCTNRYDAGVDGKVYLQCAVHAKSNKAFNCLASQRCIPNANAAQGDANRCHCDPATGTAAMGANCKVNLAYECESCLSAFYLASDLHCKRKICTCPSGTGVAAEGADCPTHDTLHCASCTTAGGYVMDIDGKTCIEKLCTCDAGTGTAAKGVDCPTHKSGKCQTCADGYIFKADGLSCKQKQCTCLLNGKRAGEGASGTTCDTDGMNKCASCDDAAGYVMDAASDLCIVKQCTCTAGTGTAASGAACDTHQAVKCASCDTGAGFKMADDGRTCICDSGRGYESAAGNTCVFKKCTCSNGKLAQGTDCPSNGNAKCMSCDAGFRLEKDQCLQNLCTCNHGTAVSGASCDVHQKHECAACTDANYELINGKCVYKICTCANGDRAEGSACPNHGAKKCAKCDGGFRLGAGSTSCLQNVCSCANGNAATGASCDVHDAHKCASCK